MRHDVCGRTRACPAVDADAQVHQPRLKDRHDAYKSAVISFVHRLWSIAQLRNGRDSTRELKLLIDPLTHSFLASHLPLMPTASRTREHANVHHMHLHDSEARRYTIDHWNVHRLRSLLNGFQPRISSSIQPLLHCEDVAFLGSSLTNITLVSSPLPLLPSSTPIPLSAPSLLVSPSIVLS